MNDTAILFPINHYFTAAERNEVVSGINVILQFSVNI